jgi:NAD dependent epimerase/dehydratase
MNWMSKRVLVTGAGGFIGSHLVELLHELGARVRAVVRYNSRNDWGFLQSLPDGMLNEIEVFPSDVSDPYAVSRMVEDCDVVFHLAALIGIPYSYIAPAQYISVNIVGTLNILQACIQSSVDRVVHTSTSEVYGTAQYVPIDEDHPLQGQSPYSASKIGADKLVESFYRSFELPVATIRPLNTFGPRQSARGVIPTIISQALTREKIQLGNITPIRDLTYVKDTARGFVAVAECDAAVGQVVNIGRGSGIAVGELADVILNLMGREVEIVTDETRVRPLQSEVERLVCDNTRAKELTGWVPTISLEAGLQETIRWIEENLDWYKPETYNV